MNKYLKLSLLSLTSLLLFCHLFFIDQGQKTNLLSLHFLGLIVVLNSVWQKKNKLNLSSDIFSTCCGFILIIFTLIKSQMPLGYNPHLSIITISIGIVLISSKFKKIRQYQQELLIVLFLGLYPVFDKLLKIINLPLVTAKISTFLLWLIGANPDQEGTIISLPTGRIEVYGGCSGIELLIFMMFVAFLFILNFPLNLQQKIICFICAILIAILTNSLRVGLLAILIANHDLSTFSYWHNDEGSWLFSIIAITLFAVFNWYWYLKPLLITNINNE